MTLPKVNWVQLTTGSAIFFLVPAYILLGVALYILTPNQTDVQLEAWTQRCRAEKKIAVQMRLVDTHVRSIGWVCLTYNEFMHHHTRDDIKWKP